MQWTRMLAEEMQVDIRSTLPFGLVPFAPPSEEEFRRAELDIRSYFPEFPGFPESYRSFCLELGPGILGFCRIFAPTGLPIAPADLRPHALRLRELFSAPPSIVEEVEEEEVEKDSARHQVVFRTRTRARAHSFPLQKLLVFAQDVDEAGLWFAWHWPSPSSSLSSVSEPEILCVDEDAEAPPPQKVAASFDEFVREVALGNRLSNLMLRRERIRRHNNLRSGSYRNEEGPDNDKDEDDHDDNDDNTNEDESGGDFEPALRVFKPFPSSGVVPAPPQTSVNERNLSDSTEEPPQLDDRIAHLPPPRSEELTQTDHVNRFLLRQFRSHMDNWEIRQEEDEQPNEF